MSEQQATYRPQPSANGNGQHRRTQTPKDDSLSSFVFGKVQPQAVPLEEGVLGALMLDREAMEQVEEILWPESFYLDSHQKIYTAIQALHRRNEPIDLLLVTEELKRTGELDNIGGGYYLVELSNRVASAANIEYHARIIAQKKVQRDLIAVSTRTIRDAYEDTTDAFQLLSEAEEQVFEISKRCFSKEAEKVSSITGSVLAQLEAATTKDGIVGVPTGLYQFDKEVGGLRGGNLYVVAARPGMGKTAWIGTAAINMAESGSPVGIFSLEMSKSQLVTRFISAKSGVSSSKIGNGEVTERDLQDILTATEGVNKMPIYVDDTPSLSISAVRARARRMVQKHGVKVVFVDYLQLMSGNEGKELKRSQNREQEIADVARALKNLAKTLDIPVVALAQLSRAVEIRGGSKRPQMSDLRESGEIENAADFCGFLWRPAYYGISTSEDGEYPTGHTEMIIGKNRHGRLCDVPMCFKDFLCIFSDVDQKLSFYGGQTSTQFPIKEFNPLAVPTGNRNLLEKQDTPF